MTDFHCIIPARKGSKRLKNKNFKRFSNSNLSEIAINFALSSNIFSKIIFSSNNLVFNSKLRKNYDIDILDRPNNLSNDKVQTFEVAQKIIFDLKIKQSDVIILLQPTSPLRNISDLKKGLRIFNSMKLNSLVSAFEIDHQNTFFSNDNKIKINKKKVFKLNGAFYFSKVKWLLKNKCFYNNNSHFFIMPKNRSIDIDRINDFKKAELIFH